MGPSGRRGRGTFAVKLHAVTLRQPDYTSVAINELGFTVHSLPIVATLRGSAFWALPGPRKAASWFRKKAGGGSMFLLPGLKYKGNAMLSISILLYFDEIDSTKNCGLHLPAVYTMCHKRKGLTVLGSFPKSCFQSPGFVVCLASVFLHGLAAAEAMSSPLSPGPRRAPCSSPSPSYRTLPDRTLSYPTLPYPTRDPPQTHPRPRPRPNPDPTQTQPRPNPDPSQTQPRPNPDPTQTQPRPIPDPSQTQPRPNPDPTIIYSTVCLLTAKSLII